MSTFFPRVRLWPGKSSSIDAATWGLGVEITDYVRRPGQDGGQVISYNSGRQDEGNQIDAGSLNLTLDNRTGIWTPQNVNGTYFGLLKRNTPIQLYTDTGSDAFTRTTVGLGTSSSGQAWGNGGGWTTNGTAGVATLAANTISHAFLAGADAYNFDIRYTCWVDQVATGAPFVMAGAARAVDNANSLMFRCDFNQAGTVDARIGRRAGATSITASALAVFSYVANTKVRVRCQGDGQAMRLKVWKPANPALPDADEPTAWTVVAADAVAAGSLVGLLAWRVGGNTNVGTPGIFVDDYAVQAEEWTGSVVQWPTRWSMTGANAWAPIQAAGVLRRLRQGQGQLQSALRRQLMKYSPSGFWPLEDGPGSLSLASAISGQQPASYVNATPAGASDLPGAAMAVTFDTPTSSITARVGKLPVDQQGWAVMWLMKMGSLPGGLTRVARIKATGRLSRWEILMDDTGITVNGYDGGDDFAYVNQSMLYGAEVNPLEWFAVQLELEFLGGVTVGWALIVHAVDSTVYYAMSGSFLASYELVVTEVTLGGGKLDGCAWSMLWVGDDNLPFVDDTFSLVSAGYDGELAAARAARVASEAAVPLLVEPGASEPMGAQREATALEVLRSCEGADYGILYETGSGLGFRPRTARYNTAPALVLSMVAGHLAAPPEPIYDDQKLRNVWTVGRVGGSAATVVDDASVALEGEVAGSDTINVATDEVLTNHAGWRTYLGVQDDLRWPSIALDFARNPSLLPYWRSRRYGFRFGVTTGLPQVAGAEPDVIAEGYQAELHPDGWRVTLNCSGASPWDVAVLDSAAKPIRLDTAGTVLNGGVNATAISWPVTITSGPIWNTAGPFPILMKCEGEIVSVTAISGAGPGQTFTVTRSVNGVVRAHATLAPVALAYPSRLAL